MTINQYSKPFYDSMADFERKQQAKNDRLVDMASRIMPPSDVKMFGSHHNALTDFAKNLNDNLDSYASSAQGQAEFYQLMNQYNQMKTDAESFFSTNYGNPNDDPKAATFMGAFLTENSGVNPFEDQGFYDQNNMKHYEDVLQKFDRNAYKPGSLSLENGQAVIKDGDAVIPASQMFPEEPLFSRNLAEYKAPSGYEFYDDVQNSFKKAHNSPTAVRNWVGTQLSDDKVMRRAIRHYLNENPSDIKIEDAYNDSDIINAAKELYLDEAVRAWSDRRTPAKTTTVGKADQYYNSLLESSMTSGVYNENFTAFDESGDQVTVLANGPSVNVGDKKVTLKSLQKEVVINSIFVDQNRELKAVVPSENDYGESIMIVIDVDPNTSSYSDIRDGLGLSEAQFRTILSNLVKRA